MKIPNFATKKELHKWLVENKEDLIESKRMIIKRSDSGLLSLGDATKNIGSAVESEVLKFTSRIFRHKNKARFDDYLKGEVDEHSVGMQYVKLTFALNDPEYKEDYAEFEKYIDAIYNKDEAVESGYFFPILEAKLIEGSSVVFGSNSITPTLSVKVISDDEIVVETAMNTTNVFDSHKDVHIPGLWTKAIKENKRLKHLDSHQNDFDKVIAGKGNVTAVTEKMPFTRLLTSYEPPVSTQGKQKPLLGTSKGMDWDRIVKLVN